MKRVFITGNAGSGKSTLGRHMAEKLGLPFTSLDTIVWKERWQKTPLKEKQQKISTLTSTEGWVIEGVNDIVLEKTDIVIFLDVSRRICFYRAAKRNARYLFKSRPDLPPHCPEILIIPTLFKIIWHFPKRIRPKILAEKMARTDSSFIHIESKKQLAAYLKRLG